MKYAPTEYVEKPAKEDIFMRWQKATDVVNTYGPYDYSH